MMKTIILAALLTIGMTISGCSRANDDAEGGAEEAIKSQIALLNKIAEKAEAGASDSELDKLFKENQEFVSRIKKLKSKMPESEVKALEKKYEKQTLQASEKMIMAMAKSSSAFKNSKKK